jgi:RNA polymerase sigma-70 factor (ECF subfamily)
MFSRPDEHDTREAADAGELVEARLVGRIAAGDLASFEALYRAYHPRLTRFLERVTRRPGLVEEVLDDTMLVVWKRASSYNGRSKVSTWIFAIAYRKALKALHRLDDSVADDDAALRESPDPGPDEQLGRRELRQVLVHAMDALSPQHRAVVDLTYFHGIGYREIAHIVDCPVDTVKTRMFHARRRLKTLLAGRVEGWL